jgi:hypothetical protein
MTIEELQKEPFHFVSHMSMEDEHVTTYASEDNHLGICDHTIYRDGQPWRTYRHWRIGKKIYKTKKKFIEAIKEL